MSSNRSNSPHSAPIPINGQSRHRSMSISSDGSPSSPPMPQTPANHPSSVLPKVATSPSNSTSPILSYFMAASPTSKSSTFPYRRPSDVFSGAPPVFEDDEAQDDPRSTHRRASTAGWSTATASRFPQPGSFAQPTPERGSGIMRRLSLSAGFTKPASPPSPTAPPSSAVSGAPPTGFPPTNNTAVRHARRATLLGPPEARPARAPSPMGERMLKGHFDGFN